MYAHNVNNTAIVLQLPCESVFIIMEVKTEATMYKYVYDNIYTRFFTVFYLCSHVPRSLMLGTVLIMLSCLIDIVRYFL